MTSHDKLAAVGSQLITGTNTALGSLLARAGDLAAWERWSTLAAQTGYCTHPVRVVGSTTTADPTTGEVLADYDTGSEPDGALLLPCRNRRATVCPTCSSTYAADTWQLTIAGLRGGKGIPASVATHPRTFATLTAPSFGPVHTARSDRRRCQLRWSACVHGSAGCEVVHHGNDPLVGTPICTECFDYEGLVLFNALAPKLWSRTAVELPRRLAAVTGWSRRATQNTIRASYSKVAEYQRRGVIHLHVVLRLDARAGAAAGPMMPPAPFDNPELLAAAMRTAISYASVPALLGDQIRWGVQSDVSIITASPSEGESVRSGQAVANYLAKYVTKSLPTSPAGTGSNALYAHHHRIAQTCRKLSRRPELAALHLADRVETLGYPSRPTSRSRAYSTTMGTLRAERARYAAARQATLVQDPSQAEVIRESAWIYAGRGWNNLGEAAYVATKAAQRLDAIGYAAEVRAQEQREVDRG